MDVCKVILFAIFEIFLVHSAHIITKTEDQANWREHKERVARFRCSLPQPRSLSYKDFIDISKLPDINSDVLPMRTVLHRCDSQTGCCARKDEVCAPLEMENVTLTFQIVTIMPNRKTIRQYETVKAKNHTRCGCEKQSNSPK